MTMYRFITLLKSVFCASKPLSFSLKEKRVKWTGSMLDLKKKVYSLNYSVLCVLTCLLCYKSSLDCGLVFDDVSAIRENRDLRPDSPWTNLLHNDFWGTPILKEQSHKSYRPVCVFTYRLNYLIHGLKPFGYHLFNIILHIAVCLLYMRTCILLVPERTAFVAAILFSVHPIHTEAVTGVVGRAEVLSAFFYLLAFLCYVSAAVKRTTTDWSWMGCSLLFVALATFSKEQGITVVGICCTYEIFILQKTRLSEIRILLSKGKRCSKDALMRMSVLFSWALFLLGVRLRVMGNQLPVFTKFDNPAAASATPIRQLTYNYLVTLNSWLLLFPQNLCCDWTMGSVPPIHSWTDPRNLCTMALYAAIVMLFWSYLWMGNGRSQFIVMALSLCIFPFLPASNLFFPVGFVVAERVLYAPSMGFCLLVAQGANLLATRRNSLVWGSVLFLVIIHASKTIRRNRDWETDYSLFLSGINVNPKNAKLYNNVGHFLETQGKHLEALEYFHTAITVEPTDIGAHMNVGRTYNHLGMYEEAETAFRKAKDLLPRPPFGDGYEARVAPSHLNVFLNLANLISRNGTRLEEADTLYQEAIRMRSDYVEAYINRGDILVRLNRTREAQNVYEKALQLDSSNADIHYNLGVVFLEQRKKEMALKEFDRALKINPRHQQALLNSAILIQETGKPQMRKLAYHRLQALLETKDVNERVYFHLGMLAMDDKNFTLAEKWFRKAVELRSDFRSALFNLALLLSEAKRPLEALSFLQQLRENHPDHVKGLILLGDIYINTLRDMDAAKACYMDILRKDPTNVQALHNLCVVHVEQGFMKEAEECLKKASVLAPHEKYIKQHLQIVHARRLSSTPRKIELEPTPRTENQRKNSKSGEVEIVDIRT